jgi:hypothetical protein
MRPGGSAGWTAEKEREEAAETVAAISWNLIYFIMLGMIINRTPDKAGRI